jgi:hypothetical protein
MFFVFFGNKQIGLVYSTHLILWLERNSLDVIRRIGLNTKQLVDPPQYDKETLRLTHMLNALHKPRLLWRSMQQTQVIIVDGEDLIFRAIDEQQSRAIRLIQRAILQERKLFCFPFERVKVVSVAVFPAQRCGEIKGIFELIYIVEPCFVKHVVSTSAQRNDTGKTLSMRVSKTNGVKAAGGKSPHAHFCRGNLWLRGDPVEQRRPLAIGRCRVRGCGGRVAGAGDFDDDAADALVPEAFHPHAEFGAVAVQTCHYEDCWCWV